MFAKVSVIIPTFNRGPVLAGAVDSVLAQLVREIEVIVVDDGSTDGTRELVQERYGHERRVRYVYQPNAGASAARNAGLDLANGAYIAFLDSDDAWKPWHLTLALAVFDRFPEAGLLWTQTEFVNAEGIVVSSSSLATLMSAYEYFTLDDLFAYSSPLSDFEIELPEEARDRRVYVGDIFSPMVMGNLILTSSSVMRRERLVTVGRFDEGLTVGEDYEFFLRTCRAGPVAFIDVDDVRYRIGTFDKLGGRRSALTMARAYLSVLDTTLARDKDRITLPASLISTARIHAYRWVGELELLAGSHRAARARFADALRIRPAQPSLIGLFFITFLPHSAFRLMVSSRHALMTMVHAWS
jgi:glycosyltransferase involved in cell wall biosynthesis